LAVRLLYDKFSNSRPTITYRPPVSEKGLENLDDGIWHFHVQFQNLNGWGAVSHFRFQIDTEPPKPFALRFVEGKETDNPEPTVLFGATDFLSGIEYYKIKIGEGDSFSVSSDIIKNNFYVLPLQAPGKRNIIVQAYDRAGNYTTATEEFVIRPIERPDITDYPKEPESGGILAIKGVSYQNIQVVIWVQREKEEPKSFVVQSDKDGKFIFTADEKLKDGIYKLWAEAVDGRGARSLPTDEIIIAVPRPVIFRIGTLGVNFLGVIISSITLILVLVFFFWHGRRNFSSVKKRVRKEVREAELVLHKTFNFLKEDIEEQIRAFEKIRNKRRLTDEEEKIIKRLEKKLDDAEKVVKKEIDDIEKEIRYKQ
jgi:hypothetical protein